MAVQITSGFSAAAARVAQARQQYQALMTAELATVRDEVEHIAIAGTRAGVYDTPPGRYIRTDALLGGVYARPIRAGGTFGIEVGNRAAHATNVEWGSMGEQQSPEELRALSEALPGVGVLYLGRSGAEWRKPNPAITRASVVAGHLLVRAHARALAQAHR
ncbi:hypothetical protein [Deinococcus aquiradiocola]|uniref:Uncharacterized protein n=1 Tax=Deinococcus aquiradiocola TaxID=393059 RepID=A0A917P7C9_9DEIO|nr:hypothetical protein [Deinococcus aquiradiocola]GGJ65370.1 hypothetical protein GCM10008939_06620 [Deinococcus aquiradiocola]